MFAQKQPCFTLLFQHTGYINLAYKIVTYLDTQTIISILDTDTQQQSSTQNQNKHCPQKHPQSHMYSMLASWCLIKQFFNRTDRTMYYSFYQEAQFLNNENSLIQSIIINQALHNNSQQNYTFAKFYSQINHLFKEIQTHLLNQEQTEELKRFVTDPMLPLPSIKRQHEGMYCNSSFQIYLVGLRFPHISDQNNFSLFEQFTCKIEDEEEISFKTFFEIKKNKNNKKKQYENLHLVRYLPYEITFNNYLQLLIQNVSLHNLIVYLFTITDIWLNATHAYLQAINDPFNKFIQLMTRYSIFRSSILEVEEAFSSFFRRYQSLYEDTIKDSIFQFSSKKPKFCFWRPALTKWFSKMQEIHKQTNQVYFLLLTQKRQERLLQLIEEPLEQQISWPLLKSIGMSLKNNLQIASMSGSIKQHIYSENTSETMIESFVKNNQFIGESLIFEYVEYMIDLSINEETVHWCGHSQHKLSRPFNDFVSCFLNYNSKYYNYLDSDLLSNILQKDVRSEVYSFLLQVDFKFLEEKNLKSVILRQIIQQLNSAEPFITQKIPNLKEEKGPDLKEQKEPDLKEEKGQKLTNELSVKDSIETTDSVTQMQIPVKKAKIYYDFTEKDAKLRYFNEKAKICESIEGQQKYFFEIPQQLSPQQILSKSISTNDSSENQQNEDEQYEYNSDDQQENCNGNSQQQINQQIQQQQSKEINNINNTKQIIGKQAFICEVSENQKTSKSIQIEQIEEEIKLQNSIDQELPSIKSLDQSLNSKPPFKNQFL